MPNTGTLLAELRSIVGTDRVLDTPGDRAFYARDLFFTGVDALAVVQPTTREALAAVVRAATSAGHAVIARGGGLSYTRGYVPCVPGTVMIDTREINRIIAMSPDNMTVTAECGCTWEQILRATMAHDLRPMHFGPTTGRYSTLGGGLSNGSMFFNSASRGTAADVVLGIEVVLADGQRVTTGSGAIRNGEAFFRYHGPDLTGVFLHDAGALGIKAAATLRLEPIPKGVAFASFAFSAYADMIAGALAVGRTGLAAECLGVGPYPAATPDDQTRRPTLHVVVEGVTQDVADIHLACVAERIGPRAERSAGAIPQFIRQDPFGFLCTPLDAGGRRQIWTHGVFPFGRALAAYTASVALLDEHRTSLEREGITVTISTAIAGTAALIEPVMTWTDMPTPLHLRGMQTVDGAALPANPQATDVVRRVRDALRDLYARLGAAHLQLGKFYAFSETVAPETQALLLMLKRSIDPKNLLNPHALGWA